MKSKYLVALFASAALAAPATAQAANSYGWAGFHAGINLGYGMGSFHLPTAGSFTDTARTYSLDGAVDTDASGIVGGGQVGYDVLLPSGWLYGLEADIAATSMTKKLSANLDLGAASTMKTTAESGLDTLGTLRTRLGYVTGNDYLIYATAGLAYGSVQTGFSLDLARGTTPLLAIRASRSRTDYGWTAGAGIEHPVTESLSLRAEYLYVDLGAYDIANGPIAVPTGTGSGSIKIGTTAHILRLGLNYSLN
jgi:outer membrane immunogenic protein